MGCQVCGDPNAKYYGTKLQSLCPSCARRTPAKLLREVFDKRYWVSDDPNEEPPNEAVKHSFYEDYLRSDLTLARYIEQTQSPC